MRFASTLVVLLNLIVRLCMSAAASWTGAHQGKGVSTTVQMFQIEEARQACASALQPGMHFASGPLQMKYALRLAPAPAADCP